MDYQKLQKGLTTAHERRPFKSFLFDTKGRGKKQDEEEVKESLEAGRPSEIVPTKLFLKSPKEKSELLQYPAEREEFFKGFKMRGWNMFDFFLGSKS